MDSTLLLARAWGLLLVVLPVVFLASPRALGRWVQALGQTSFTFMTAYVAIILGAFTVASHNVWLAEWPVILTLLGWLSIAKGVGRLVYPEQALALEEHVNERPMLTRISFGLMSAIGFFLIYQGFLAGKV